jgi:ABC-type transport system involved in multi-copper enzyme maturation permease subunit
VSEAVVEEGGARRRWPRPWQNPVALKELRGRMRGRRAFMVLTLYLGFLIAVVGLIYFLLDTAARQPFGPDSRTAGRTLFVTVLVVQTFLVVFIAPALTAGSISGEKERQTFDLLRTTLLSARSLVAGKLFSALAYVFLLILAAVPVQSIAFLLGGVTLTELIVTQLLIIVSAVTFAMVGLFWSSVMRSNLAAVVATYVTALILTAAAPLTAGIVASSLGAVLFGASTPPYSAMVLLAYGGLLLVATNLPATLVMTEILLAQGVVFYTTMPINGRSTVIPASWPFYLIIYGLMALFLFWWTVDRVRRVPVS